MKNFYNVKSQTESPFQIEEKWNSVLLKLMYDKFIVKKWQTVFLAENTQPFFFSLTKAFSNQYMFF